MTKAHLTDYLKTNAATKQDKPGIVFEGKTISWGELWDRVELTGSYLADLLGTDEQKVVDILLTNSIELVIAYLSVLHAGHIALPLDPAYKKLELDAIIDQIPPELIITDTRYDGQIGQHKAAKLMVDDLLQQKSGSGRLLRLPTAQQIASLTFTSGTSGKPKAVPNTHSNHIWNIQTCSAVWDWTSDDTLLITLPLSHWYGLVMGLSGAIYHGNTLYLHQQSFKAEEILSSLSSGKISLFTHVPLAYIKMLELPASAKYDLSAVRLCISGSAPLPPTVWQDFKSRYSIEILETYGSSETGRIAGNSLSKRMLGSPGKILPGVKARIGHNGGVEIKSEGLFPGYYHNKAATLASLTDDGYWKTDDLGEIKDGYVYLRGRKQELLRRFGYTISPRDIEWALYKNPKIKDIYVMGYQQPGQPGDKLAYILVGDITDKELADYCKSNLLFAWRADKVIRLIDLPRTPMGKPKIAALKKLIMTDS